MIVVDWSLQRLKEKLLFPRRFGVQLKIGSNIGSFYQEISFYIIYILASYSPWFAFLSDWFNRNENCLHLSFLHGSRLYPQCFVACNYDFRISFHLVTDINIATRGEEELLQGGICFSPGTKNVWSDIHHSILNIACSKGRWKTKKMIKKKYDMSNMCHSILKILYSKGIWNTYKESEKNVI